MDALMDEIRAAPFQWGRNDCAVGLAVRTVLALTGENLGTEFVGRYANADEAAALLAEHGHHDVADYVATLLKEIPPARARVGDLVAIPVPGPLGHGLGVVVGERVVTLTMTGIGTVDRRRAARGYLVG
jgi:hypothetical protein